MAWAMSARPSPRSRLRASSAVDASSRTGGRLSTSRYARASLSEVASSCRQGVLAFGDSITNGGGELQWGVALKSWAHWVARGLGLPFTSYATDGAKIAHVVGQQLPAHQSRFAHPDARFELGCLYIGVHDVRAEA